MEDAFSVFSFRSHRKLSCNSPDRVSIHANTNMKTITLDEDAYERLKAWKKGSRESFSSVVKRVIPQPGTLGAFLSHVQANGTNETEKDDLMEESINDRSAVKEDPWI